MPTQQGRLPYHLRSFVGGISDFEDRGIAGAFKMGSGLDIRKKVDSLSAGQALTDDLAPGTMTAIPYFIVPADDGNIYFFCYDGKIYRRNQSGAYSLVYTETNESGQIVGAAQWYDNAGNTYLFYATATRLNIKRILGSGYTPAEPWTDVNTVPTGTWPKTNLTLTRWHTMKQINGALLICNDKYVALVGYDMSYTNNALQLIPGNISKTLVERGIYAIIGTNRSSNNEECSIYAWDNIALSYNNKQVMKVTGINCSIDTEIAIMQVGSKGQLYLSDLNNPLPLLSFPGGGSSNPDAVTSDRGMALFGIFGNTDGNNGVYSYGRLRKNAPIAANLEYALTCDEIGSICKDGANIYIGYKNGTNYGIKKTDPNTKADAWYKSLDLVAPLGTRRFPIPLGRFLNWGWADIYFMPLPAGCGIEIWYRLDKVADNTSLNTNADTSGWIKASLQDQPGVYRMTTTGAQNAIWAINEKAQVLELQILLYHSGNTTPEVMEANVYMNFG